MNSDSNSNQDLPMHCLEENCALFRGCRCAGCAALAVQAIRMAHIQVARLIARVDKKQEQQPSRWRAVGQSLMRVVHVHICLLLDTEAKQSATRASVWRAEHCLKEWERLRERGLQVDVLLVDEHQVRSLWLLNVFTLANIYMRL